MENVGAPRSSVTPCELDSRESHSAARESVEQMLEREGETIGGEASGGFQVLGLILLMLSHPMYFCSMQGPSTEITHSFLWFRVAISES